MLNSLIGLHEPGGEDHFSQEDKGWVVFTHELGRDPLDTSSVDYSHWSIQGLGCIARLNHGYGRAGTIPHIQYYADFAQRCANWVANSNGCWLFIIGNEPNVGQERPDGSPIFWENYLDCFTLCYDKIKEVRPDVLVLPAAIGPWNIETGNWLEYQRNIVSALLQRDKLDGGVIHAYTHEYDMGQITVDDIRHGWQWQFRTYQDQVQSFPPGYPLYITESNPVSGWEDENIGYIVSLYSEIFRWNQDHPDQTIYCCCLYRWPLVHDQPQWAISTRPNVIADLDNAVEIGFPFENEDPPPNGGNMNVVFSTGFEDGKFPPYNGQDFLLVPEGWHPDWVPGVKPGPVRPEVQPEDREKGDRGIHSGRFGAKLAHAYSFFDAVLYRTLPSTQGKKYVARGWATAESQGGLGNQIGIDPTGGTDFRADSVVWSDWWGTDFPEFEPYFWRQMSTGEVTAECGRVTVFLRVKCRNAVQVNAGFWDDIELLEEEGSSPPPPPEKGHYEVDLQIKGTIRYVPE